MYEKVTKFDFLIFSVNTLNLGRPRGNCVHDTIRMAILGRRTFYFIPCTIKLIKPNGNMDYEVLRVTNQLYTVYTYMRNTFSSRKFLPVCMCIFNIYILIYLSSSDILTKCILVCPSCLKCVHGRRFLRRIFFCMPHIILHYLRRNVLGAFLVCRHRARVCVCVSALMRRR